MNYYRMSRLKWYHILFGVLGVVFVAGIVVYFMFGRNRLEHFVEDETDIVA